MRVTLLPVVLLAACRGPTAVVPFAQSPFCTEVQGQRSAMKLKPGRYDLHGFTLVVQQLGSPREPDFLLQVQGPSVRRAVLRGGGGVPCVVPPLPDDVCTDIDPDDLMWELIERAHAREGAADVRHAEAIVTAWEHVDPAAQHVVSTLRAWRIGTPFLLRVQPPTCVQLVEAR